jgi:hypothetical protein
MEQRIVCEVIGRNQNTISEVIFTDGNRFIKIESASLADALKFEKELNKARSEKKR